MQLTIVRSLAAILFALSMTASLSAQEALPAPEGEVLLTLSGEIAVTNGDGVARFDRAMLEAMPAVTVSTSTIWTEGVQEFTGVPLADLLARVGVTEGVLSATAINDYAVEIPVTDAVAGGPIVAYALDGQPMSVRDKGPLWIVYPYDDNADYRTEVIYSRSIWQLDRIVVTH